MGLYLVISDIHDNLDNVDKLLAKVAGKKPAPDGILFLGDLTSPFTIVKLLKGMPEVAIKGVFGNNDGDKPTIIKAARGRADLRDYLRVEEIDGVRLVLMHGFGPPEATERIAMSLAKSRDYKVVLFGHTHKVFVAKLSPGSGEPESIITSDSWDFRDCVVASVPKDDESVLVVNPGTLGGWLAKAPSFGFLEIGAEEITVRIIPL